ncbi:MAG: hypothetical protein LBB98_06285 [Treponema sp.]|jgi:hypothetical protein|nr:hypothetical protein [Treponema sp.]
MKVPKQKRIPVNISLPVDFYCHLEDLWHDRWNRGHTVLRLREFLAELVSLSFQTWQERNAPQRPGLAPEETPAAPGDGDDWREGPPDSEPCLLPGWKVGGPDDVEKR